MVRADVAGALEPEGGQPGEHLALVGDRRGVHHVVGRDAVGGDQQQAVVADRVDVPDLALERCSRAAASLTGARLPREADCFRRHPGSLGRHNAGKYRDRRDQRERARCARSSSQRGPGEREQRLDELDLADLRHAAAREPGVPGEEAEQRADRPPRRRSRARRRRRVEIRAVTAATSADRAAVSGSGRARAPSRSPASRRSRARARRPRRSRSRRGRPRPGLAGRPLRHAGALRGGERRARPTRPARARQPRSPEDGCSPARSTATTAVAAGSSPTITALCAEVRSRSASALNSGKPNTTPERHDREAPQLRPRSGSGARAASRISAGEDGGDRLAPEADEDGIELLDRDARGRQREAEGEHAEEAEEDRHGG